MFKLPFKVRLSVYHQAKQIFIQAVYSSLQQSYSNLLTWLAYSTLNTIFQTKTMFSLKWWRVGLKRSVFLFLMMTFRQRKIYAARIQNKSCPDMEINELWCCLNLNNMLLLINAEKLCWLLTLLPVSHYSQFIWKCFTGMRRQDVELLELTWLHHVGMGPREGGKQQADTDTCIFLSSDVREATHWLQRVDVCVLERVRFQGYGTPLISVCWKLYDYAFLFISLTLSLSFSLCVCLCVCVRTLPEGKIRHELGKQALQSWSVLQTRRTEG